MVSSSSVSFGTERCKHASQAFCGRSITSFDPRLVSFKDPRGSHIKTHFVHSALIVHRMYRRGHTLSFSISQKSSPFAQRLGRFSIMMALRLLGISRVLHLPETASRSSRRTVMMPGGAPQRQLNTLLNLELWLEDERRPVWARGPTSLEKLCAASSSRARYTEFHAREYLPPCMLVDYCEYIRFLDMILTGFKTSKSYKETN